MIDETRVFSKQLAFGLIGSGLFLSAIIFLQITNNTPPVHYGLLTVYFSYASTLIVLPALMLLGVKYSAFKLPAVIWYHLTMAILLLYFSEAYSPFTPVWSILILFATIYFGWRGFIGSSLCLFGTVVTYIILFALDKGPDLLLYSLLSVLVSALTIFTSYLFVRIIMNNRRNTRELAITQKSEQMQVNRLNTLLNSISDAVMTLNGYGRITSQNAAAQAFFDTNQSLIGREIDKLLALIDSDNHEVSVHDLINETKSSKLRDDLSTNVGGDHRHISLQLSRIHGTFGDDEKYGVVMIIRDITKQKTLEDEKDEFISVTSHELRTPVAIAEGSLSNLMLMYERQADEGKLRAAANMAYEQIIYLSKMINDLSTLSRAERGVGDDVETINISELLQDLFSRYTPEAQKKSLELNLDIPDHLSEVKTSRLYLEEILQNFITNAIKYTQKGKVTIGAKVMPDGKIQLSVVDSGIGMSKTDIDHIFEKFYRSEDYRTRETSGTGLGLYVVQKLAAKLDTKIEVRSRLDHGSTFSFVLPAESAEGDINVIEKTEKVAEPVV